MSATLWSSGRGKVTRQNGVNEAKLGTLAISLLRVLPMLIEPWFGRRFDANHDKVLK
jgi:hypothetical protein